MIWYILTNGYMFSFENAIGVIAPIKKLEYYGKINLCVRCLHQLYDRGGRTFGW